MKKKLLILLCSLLLSVSLIGCDTTDDPDKVINVTCDRGYINTTESWSINSHNDYRAYEVTEDYDEEADEYTVVLKFKKVVEGN